VTAAVTNDGSVEHDSLVGLAETVRDSVRNPERFGAVFDTYYAEIHGYVARRLGSEVAADLTADTFLAAFKARERYDPARAGVRTWLYGIATNLVGKQRRTEIRALRALSRLDANTGTEGHDDRVSTQVSAEGVRGELAAALAELNPGERDVVLLVAIAELSHDEIAAALGVSYGTVGARLSRARTKLRAALGGTNPLHDREERHG
jgi:RNA polymerase sigma factor (sigma-70 family)